jgi:catechol-2,3-dioxygenase
VITRLNHAVLFVRDALRSAAFYQDALGFTVVGEASPNAAFLRASGSSNHHDLGLFSVGEGSPGPAPRGVGLYHLAWEVETIEELASFRDELSKRGSLVGASDHGVTKSLYAKDPDGIEFEVLWTVPRKAWADGWQDAVTQPLHLERELATWGADAKG